MWASTLLVNSRSRHLNTTKYVVTCAANPTTNEWLAIVGSLSPPTQKDVRRVLEGILENHENVVIKLGASQSIYKDYRIANELRDIPGFIRPHCYVECDDDKDPGSATKMLVLPFFEEGSMRSWNWSKKPTALLHACLCQCIGSLLQAYESKGILHIDTHLDNVLLRKTSVESVAYTLGGHTITVPTHGYMIAIMDFEVTMSEMLTYRGRAIAQVYEDILHAVFDLEFNDTSDIVGYIELVTTLLAFKERPVDVYTAWQTLQPLVLKLCAIPKVSRSFTYDSCAL